MTILDNIKALRDRMKAKDLATLKLAENDGDDADLVVLDEVFKVDEKVDTVIEQVGRIELIKGDKGDSIRGEKGEKGDRGDIGETGAQGQPGIQGRIGLQGIPGKDGRDGLDAPLPSPEFFMPMIQASLPTLDDIENDIPRFGARVRDSLELLQGEDRLDVSAIKGIAEIVEALRKAIRNSVPIYVGAGSTQSSSTPSTVYTETPDGDIDGINTDYTTTHTITTVIGMWINGEFIHPSEYTVTGAGFSMITPLGVEFAGASFTISYV